MSAAFKYALLASLYLAQGLPYGFFTQALPVLMRDRGHSLTAIGATGILFLPWALKFLWAPLVDRYGTRRQWILPLQFATAGGALALALLDFARHFELIFLALLLFNLFAAMQDVATDGLAVNLLAPRERGLGNGIQVGAYRIGMILGGGLLLWVFARQGWTAMFLCMGALLLPTCLPVLALRDPPAPAPAADPPPRAVLAGWWRRLRLPGMLGFVGLICAYKFGDSMAAALVGPMMRDHGLTKEQIALLKGTLGSAATLAGAAAGGWLAFRRGRRAALLFGGLAQTASLALYGLFVAGLGGLPMLWAACLGEHLLGGMAVVALFTLMMDASDPQHASTDYTLLACAIVLTQGTAALAGGIIADHLGYTALFALGTLLSGAGCLWLVAAVGRGAGPARVRQAWTAAGLIPVSPGVV